jgi:hypothetical protein
MSLESSRSLLSPPPSSSFVASCFASAMNELRGRKKFCVVETVS